MKFGYCISAKENKTTLIIDILLLQALKARISEERQARDVEITSLRMQSKRDIAALEAKLAQSSSHEKYRLRAVGIFKRIPEVRIMRLFSDVQAAAVESFCRKSEV